MTSNQINLVQSSFRQVLPRAETAAKIFYKRLFELDDSLQALFPSDMLSQGNKLMQFLGLAVVSLSKPEKLYPALRTLGARHAAYGVREKDYDAVGSALVRTLEGTLGTAFTPELEEAWIEIYAMISAEMKSGAATPPLPTLELPPTHKLNRAERQTPPLH